MVRKRSAIQAQCLFHLFSVIQTVCLQQTSYAAARGCTLTLQGIPTVCRGGQSSCDLYRIYCDFSGKAKFRYTASSWWICMAVKAGRWQTLALQAKSCSRLAVSSGKRWETGTPADARLSLSSGDDLKMASLQQLWANKRENQTVRSWGAQIKISKLGVMSCSELIRHHVLFRHCQSFFSHLLHDLNIKGWVKGVWARHCHQTTYMKDQMCIPFPLSFNLQHLKIPLSRKAPPPTVNYI